MSGLPSSGVQQTGGSISWRQLPRALGLFGLLGPVSSVFVNFGHLEMLPILPSVFSIFLYLVFGFFGPVFGHEHIDQIEKFGSTVIYTKWQHFTCHSDYIGTQVHRMIEQHHTVAAQNLQLAMYKRAAQLHPRSAHNELAINILVTAICILRFRCTLENSCKKARHYPFSTVCIAGDLDSASLQHARVVGNGRRATTRRDRAERAWARRRRCIYSAIGLTAPVVGDAAGLAGSVAARWCGRGATVAELGLAAASDRGRRDRRGRRGWLVGRRRVACVTSSRGKQTNSRGIVK
jgi:hypothetical protein